MQNLLAVACGILCYSMWDLVSQPGMDLGPLHWECRVLANEHPGSPILFPVWTSCLLPSIPQGHLDTLGFYRGCHNIKRNIDFPDGIHELGEAK